jgi:hypothetical protein
MKLSCYIKDQKMTTPYLAGWRLGDVLLCCPGPSLAEIPSELRRPGLVIAAINTAYPKVTPDIWFGMDVPECYNTSLVKESFIKVFRDCYSAVDFNGGPLHDHFNTYFTTVEEHPSGVAGMIDFDFPFVPWFRDTLATTLYILMWMGAKNIYLAGCDLGGDKDYWDDRVLDPEMRVRNRNLYSRQLNFLASLKPLAESIGVNIISATKDSPINTYLESVDINELLDSFPGPSSEKPEHVVKVRASKLSEITSKLYWNGLLKSREFKSDKGVLVMSDKEQEWMLPWWYENYSRYNSLPVHFVDIGMSDEMKKWCKQYGSFSSLPPVPLKNWFKKPYALMKTPFLHTVYMDIDCEVKGPLEPLFEYAEPIGMSMDLVNNFTVSNVPVSTGLIVYEYGNELITKWAQDTNYNSQFMRGDMDIMQVILQNTKMEFNEIPADLHWVRIRGENDNALVYHWSGKVGKDHILKQMAHDLAAN